MCTNRYVTALSTFRHEYTTRLIQDCRMTRNGLGFVRMSKQSHAIHVLRLLFCRSRQAQTPLLPTLPRLFVLRVHAKAFPAFSSLCTC